MTIEIPNPTVLSPYNTGLTQAQLIEIMTQGSWLDASGRFRSSDPVAVFDSSQEFDFQPLLWEHVTAGTGTATYTQALNSSVLATAGAGAGAKAMRRSKVYWRYTPNKSHLIRMTGVLAYAGTPTGAAEARIGLNDDDNGVFFGRDATGYFVCVRSDTTGAVVDTKTRQEDWDDPLDGTGPSGITIDFTKSLIFSFNFLWLGSGPVRFSLLHDGQDVEVHAHISALVGPYMRTANLPLSYEVVNDGGAGSDISVLATCVAIESEGGQASEPGLPFQAGTAGSLVTCANSATLTPVFTVRLRDTFGGLTYRGHVRPKSLDFLNTANAPGYYQLVWNAATLTGATFANNSDATNSGVEYDTAATALTGGTVIQSGYIPNGGAGANAGLGGSGPAPEKLILARTYANMRDTLTLAARGIGGAITLAAALSYREIR